jgi:hypothetical protein
VDGGAGHLDAQSVQVLVAGSYIVCAAPLTSAGAASTACAPAQAPAAVMNGTTTDVNLVSQCTVPGNGGVHGNVAFNDPPVIKGVTLPTTPITSCAAIMISVTASDPEGDAITYAWKAMSGPSTATLTGNGASATFSATVKGEYQVKVTATDVTGGATSLTFPVQVGSSATCP